MSPRRLIRNPRMQFGAVDPTTGERATDTPYNQGVDRTQIIGGSLRTIAGYSWRLLVVGALLWVLWWILDFIWVVVLPITMALLLTTILWPSARWLVKHGWPSALAAMTTMLGLVALVAGAFVAMAPTVVDQSTELADEAVTGMNDVADWASGPPLNINQAQIDEWLTAATDQLSARSSDIASGVWLGVSALASFTITSVLVLVLTFFFLKDGANFLPWVRKVAGRTAGRHLTEVFTRVWATVSGFIRTQAIVSAVDAVFIGAGLLIMGIPLAFVLATLTFFAGFIPVVGAFTAGALAVLVALIAKGPIYALLVLGLVVLVQQLEGNVLQPWLQGRSMDLHAGIILLAVAAGGSLKGIVGAFLAVPIAAAIAVVYRYINEQIDLRAGDLLAVDAKTLTPEGNVTALIAQQEATRMRAEIEDDDVPAMSADVDMDQTDGKVPWWKRVLRKIAA